jgi:hypothetical protein
MRGGRFAPWGSEGERGWQVGHPKPVNQKREGFSLNRRSLQSDSILLVTRKMFRAPLRGLASQGLTAQNRCTSGLGKSALPAYEAGSRKSNLCVSQGVAGGGGGGWLNYGNGRP